LAFRFNAPLMVVATVVFSHEMDYAGEKEVSP